ncbi:hypothetical protein BCR36DRAFT_41184 [Piromyces finnis]|uniref:Uncharacterized protein n=1 Tax=Piromyces finnis TaxID=1754191 RepID=A0A1Y1VAY0_9FUNG|nr:hypothetical protein BCR36DRAFT_41184 [Piromyces finnis]|eukprot:ORX51445.1 hypothetical protein BCR36DRAFT_41184 [Piromyces finnis]
MTKHNIINDPNHSIPIEISDNVRESLSYKKSLHIKSSYILKIIINLSILIFMGRNIFHKEFFRKNITVYNYISLFCAVFVRLILTLWLLCLNFKKESMYVRTGNYIHNCISIYYIYLLIYNLSYYLIYICLSLLCNDWVKLVKKIYNLNSNHFINFIYKFMNKYYCIFTYIMIALYGIFCLLFCINNIPIITLLQVIIKVFLIIQCLMFYYYGYEIVTYLKKGFKLQTTQYEESKKYIKKIKNLWNLTLYCIYSYALTFIYSMYIDIKYSDGFPITKSQFYFDVFLEITTFYCLIILIINALNISRNKN